MHASPVIRAKIKHHMLPIYSFILTDIQELAVSVIHIKWLSVRRGEIKRPLRYFMIRKCPHEKGIIRIIFSNCIVKIYLFKDA